MGDCSQTQGIEASFHGVILFQFDVIVVFLLLSNMKDDSKYT
jgi:hypothetical protein